ncbi:MAG: hypothetical protein OMM_05096 [Candidatus Magnetoglobus multicellularis str. Araruama]|uniref:Peptidase C14 caspase domain-containing protein n=1 Tax=Candidatus Magnetoglobus multicellularis str. Araruama TaxID=890399 RepID=A0A1V1NY80_9BACT|nr:MAG: hypothetical protein OMM_05096 [Candidatus Magnetoglobus multicellularis str. Araruama]
MSTVISLCLGFNPFIETIASPNLIDKNIMSDVTFRSIPRLTINDLGLENEGSKIYIQAFETNRNNKIFEQTASNCLHNVINIENNPKTKSHLYVLWGIELLKNKEHEKAKDALEKASNYKSTIYTKCLLLETYQKILNKIITNSPSEKDLPKKDLQYLKELNSKIKNLKQSLQNLISSSGTKPNNYLSGKMYYDWINAIDPHGQADYENDFSISYQLQRGQECLGDIAISDMKPFPVGNHSDVYYGFNNDHLKNNNLIKKSDKRILSIGIDKYSGKFDKLQFAVSDAIKTSEAFEKYGYKSKILKNNTAFKSNIFDELFNEVLNSNIDDTFILYISGHGFSDINGNLFIIPYSKCKNYPVISLSEINSILSFHKGKTYALLDTCFDNKEVDLSCYIKNLPLNSDNQSDQLNKNYYIDSGNIQADQFNNKLGRQTKFILASNTKAIESKFLNLV